MTPQSFREEFERAFRKEYGWSESQNMMYVPEFYATALWSARWMAEKCAEVAKEWYEIAPVQIENEIRQLAKELE